MSRTAAVKAARGRHIDAELAARGVVARATGHEALAEEMPEAYKDVREVVTWCIDSESRHGSRGCDRSA